MQERLAALQAEEAELDKQIAALLPTAEAALLRARKQADTVSTAAFETHLAQQLERSDTK